MKLAIEDKVALLDGQDVWHTKSLKGIPSIMMADGPHGLRKQVESTDNLGLKGSILATAFPTASLTACSFDRDLIAKMAKLIAKEAQANKVNIVLGPGINIKRSPLCGRNFEYFSEDPYLSGELGAAFVKAMETSGTGTSVKHFFCNNQEKNRFFINSVVDDRALREIYLKAFERVIKEKPASVMASYNKINGHYATESPVLNNILRREWKFQGIVVSDWGAVHNRIESVKASTDLEMPSSMGYRSKQVLKAVESDDVLKRAIDCSYERLVQTAKSYHKIEDKKYNPDKHHEEARIIARESMVLLKNEGILPLDKKDKVAIIGGFVDDIRYQGGGSSHINPTRLDQISDIYKNYSKNIQITKGYSIKKDVDDEQMIEEALKIAQNAEKIVYLLGLPESHEVEGFDRKTLNLPQNQVSLLMKIREINPNIAIVAMGGSVMNLHFKPPMKAILLAYLGGQASSLAIMDLLYGLANPSGRLAETFIDDIKICNVQLTNDNNSVYYDESIYVGYRYYQSYNQRVHFPFGHGLSYTKFEYSNFGIEENKDAFVISMDLKNIGDIKGKEVVQIYIENKETTVYRAKYELKQFEKVELNPDETKTVTLTLPKSAFEYFDIYKRKFMIEQGEYLINISKNVEDIIHSFSVELDGDKVKHPELSYVKYTYETTDFAKIYQGELPPKHIRKGRPYTLSSTLEDTKKTFIGRSITKKIMKESSKATAHMEDEWMGEFIKQTLMETPIQMLALFSAGKYNLYWAEGLVDVLNLKIFRGFRKMRKNSKKNK